MHSFSSEDGFGFSITIDPPSDDLDVTMMMQAEHAIGHPRVSPWSFAVPPIRHVHPLARLLWDHRYPGQQVREIADNLHVATCMWITLLGLICTNVWFPLSRGPWMLEYGFCTMSCVYAAALIGYFLSLLT